MTTPSPVACGNAPSIRASAFIFVTDLSPSEAAWPDAESHARDVARSCARTLGYEPEVTLATLDSAQEDGNEWSIQTSILHSAAGGANEIFVLPVALEFNVLQREALGIALAEARRLHSGIAIHHDDLDAADPLLIESLADQAARALQPGDRPQDFGVLLAGGGCGDAGSRAQTYRLMRLIWERLGLRAGSVGFLRHAQPFLAAALDESRKTGLQWIVLPQTQWGTRHFEYAQVILENYQRAHPEAVGWRIAQPPRAHPALTAWLTQRIARLWNEKRTREQTRVVSARSVRSESTLYEIGGGMVGSVADSAGMKSLVEWLMPAGVPDRVIVKVTWHGYATGTYTDPAALDLLLGALPAKALIVEGHTSSRNLGGAPFDWETESRENRAWIRQQDAEYMRRTGLGDVLRHHEAEYVNVTEAFWDGTCAPAEKVDACLQEKGVVLRHPELAAIIPEILLDYAGCPMISFAKFKGPTRLAISNLFGLLPEPLRAAWHGPNITYFARVCCDIARLYGALFPLYGMDEALFTAVRWNRRGLYRSRWGNYDLIHNAGIVTAGQSLVSPDILASRLQGQDVYRSAFFDVVAAELGVDEPAASGVLPDRVRLHGGNPSS